MKKWLIASTICMVPIVFLGIVNPIVYLIATKQPNHGIRPDVFLWFIIILCICIGVVLITTVQMISYSSWIDRSKERDREMDLERDELQKLVRHYNNLIRQKEAS